MRVQKREITGLPGRLSDLREVGLASFLLLAIALVAGLAAIGGGAIDLRGGARVEVAIAVAGLICVIGIATGALRVPRTRVWIPVLLLGAFAAWSALTMIWSVAPDGSWLAANRAIAYCAAAAIVLVAASSVRESPSLAAVGLVCFAVAVALFALGGKIAPGISIGPLELDPGGRFSRLSEPLDYWNALALICVMAAPACIWLATLRSAASPVRIGAALALALLILTAALAYSRGAIIAYAVVLALIVAAGPRRLSLLAVGIGGVFAVAPALLLAFTRDDLSGSGVPLDDRVTGGILLGLITLVCLVALALGMRELIRAEERIAITPRQRRNAWRALGAAAAIGVVALVIVAVGAEGGLDGEVTQSADPATGAGNTPGRLVSVNSSNRTEWWREATEAFADRPLTGRGAGAFPVIHYLYRDEVADVRSSHSLPLMFLSETGLIGFGLGMGALLGLAWAAVLRIRESEGIERSARIALAAAFAAWFVQSLYDWHWEIPGVTIPALIAIVVAAAPTPRRRRYAKPEAPPRHAALAGAAAALAIATIAASAYLPVFAEDRQLDALAASDGSPEELEEALADAELAHRLNPFAVEPLFTASSLASRAGDEGRSLQLLRDAAEVQPDNWQPWRRLLTAYAAAGYLEEASDAYEEFVRTDPLQPGVTEEQIRAGAFTLRYPPTASPTVFGTPP